MDHVDALNDIALDEGTIEQAQHAVRRYCEEHDLDPDGFTVVREYDEWLGEYVLFVTEAE